MPWPATKDPTAMPFIASHRAGFKLRAILLALATCVLAMPTIAQEAPPQPSVSKDVEQQPPAEAQKVPPSPTPQQLPRSKALPHDLSPWGMFQSADSVVKAVLIGLAVASFLTWTVWAAKAFELWAAK